MHLPSDDLYLRMKKLVASVGYLCHKVHSIVSPSVSLLGENSNQELHVEWAKQVISGRNLTLFGISSVQE